MASRTKNQRKGKNARTVFDDVDRMALDTPEDGDDKYWLLSDPSGYISTLLTILLWILVLFSMMDMLSLMQEFQSMSSIY